VETGIQAQPTDIGLPTWRRRATFLHAGGRRLQDEVVVPVRVPQPRPVVDKSGQLDDEKATYLGFKWWPVADIETSTEKFYPGPAAAPAASLPERRAYRRTVRILLLNP
jgi:hypothetical protein